MEILHSRYNFGEKSTLAKWEIDGIFACYALEDKVREVDGKPVAAWKIPHVTAIPRGRYRVALDHSPKFSPRMDGLDIPHILDVPGYTDVRIHWGNTDADTDGCLLVGAHVVNDDFLGESRVTFEHVLTLMENAVASGEEIWITVE